MLKSKSEEIGIAFMVIKQLFVIEGAVNVAKFLKKVVWPCCYSYLPDRTFLYTYDLTATAGVISVKTGIMDNII